MVSRRLPCLRGGGNRARGQDWCDDCSRSSVGGLCSWDLPQGIHMTKESMMRRFSVSTMLLALGVGLSLIPHARADMPAGGTYSVSPRVSATVLALEPQGLATIRTTTGATSEVVQHPSWQVGDQVACKRVASAHVQVPWERLDCQKVSD